MYLSLSDSSAESKFRQLSTDQPALLYKQVMVIYPRGQGYGSTDASLLGRSDRRKHKY